MVRLFLFIALPLLCVSCSSLTRPLLYHPSHHHADNGLERWIIADEVVGFKRGVSKPKTVWLMLHGNGGQASDRRYAIPCFPTNDAVYILEYPGYGQRKGKTSRKSIDTAAQHAYTSLLVRYPNTPVCIVSESIGSGPACSLAASKTPPAKLVLIVPFDKLCNVAERHYPILPTSCLLSGYWDNLTSLRHYHGPLDIFAAENDSLIPYQHALALKQVAPQANFQLIPGGHNDWSLREKVTISAP